MITAAQAQEYLDAVLGVAVPAFLLTAALDDIEALEPAMLDAGYGEATITRIQAMTAAIVVGGDFARTIKSQTAPSGAARSFDNTDKAVSALRRSLAALDTSGVTATLIGPDPSALSVLMVF